MISGSTGSGPAGPVGSIWSRWRDSFGETHLTLDAVVAYVDGELAPGPAQRAAEHAARCLLCAGEVAEQRRTRGRLRGADTPGAPSSLLSALRAIPDETLPSPPPGPEPLAARDEGPGDEHDGGPDHDGSPRARREDARAVRRGLPVVAVASGIALGSVALAAVPALPMTSQIARSIGPGATASGRALPGVEPAFTTAAPSSARATAPPAPGTGVAAVPEPTGPPSAAARPGPAPARVVVDR